MATKFVTPRHPSCSVEEVRQASGAAPVRRLPLAWAQVRAQRSG